jgi:hypothetical protein
MSFTAIPPPLAANLFEIAYSSINLTLPSLERGTTVKNFRRRAFPLVPVIALVLYVGIGVIKARTAAVLSPCEEEQIMEGKSAKFRAVADVAPRPWAILLFDGVAIFDAMGSAELLGRHHTYRQFSVDPVVTAFEPLPIEHRVGGLTDANTPVVEMAMFTSKDSPASANDQNRCKRKLLKRKKNASGLSTVAG